MEVFKNRVRVLRIFYKYLGRSPGKGGGIYINVYNKQDGKEKSLICRKGKRLVRKLSGAAARTGKL